MSERRAVCLWWLAVAMCGSCTPVLATPKPIQVHIANLPKHEPVRCYLGEMPEPPEPLALKFEDDNIITRTTVNIRQYNDLVAWAKDLGHWVWTVNECMALLSGDEQ